MKAMYAYALVLGCGLAFWIAGCVMPVDPDIGDQEDDPVEDDDDAVGDDDTTSDEYDDDPVPEYSGVVITMKPCDVHGTSMPGDLEITLPSDIADFCDAGHTIVEGDVIVEHTRMLNLDGLECLCQVDGDVWIHGNSMLHDIDGLAGLKYVMGSFSIDEDSGMIDADGTTSLRFVGGDFTLHNVSSIGGPVDGHLAGFSALIVVGGAFTVEDTSSIVHITGFGALQSVGDDFTIHSNAALADVSGFASLHSVYGDVTVTNNPALATVDAEDLAYGIATVTGSITVSGNGP